MSELNDILDATQCPECKRLRTESRVHEMLAWLAAEDIVFWSHYNEETKQHDDGAYPSLLVNEEFCYGADAEGLSDDDVPVVFELYKSGGWDAVISWVAKLRDMKPLRHKLRDNCSYDHCKYDGKWCEVCEPIPVGGNKTRTT